MDLCTLVPVRQNRFIYSHASHCWSASHCSPNSSTAMAATRFALSFAAACALTVFIAAATSATVQCRRFAFKKSKASKLWGFSWWLRSPTTCMALENRRSTTFDAGGASAPSELLLRDFRLGLLLKHLLNERFPLLRFVLDIVPGCAFRR